MSLERQNSKKGNFVYLIAGPLERDLGIINIDEKTRLKWEEILSQLFHT